MRVGAFGEVMMRFTPPERLMLEQTHSLRMDFTGTGVNILGNLSHFDIESSLLTALPDNRLGNAAIANLRSLGINNDFIIKQHQHMGSYFAEMGWGSRPTQITYQNRFNSSFGLSSSQDYDLEGFINQMDIIHICGISLLLTAETADTAINIARIASEVDKIVCFDFNFRPSLANRIEDVKILSERYKKIIPYCNIVFGSINDIENLYNIHSQKNEIEIIKEFIEKNNIDVFFGTERTDDNGQKLIRGYAVTPNKVVSTKVKALKILDRIGAGDAFASGALLGYIEKWSLKETVEFAISNSILAHTIQGDVPLTTIDMVKQFMNDPSKDLIR